MIAFAVTIAVLSGVGYLTLARVTGPVSWSRILAAAILACLVGLLWGAWFQHLVRSAELAFVAVVLPALAVSGWYVLCSRDRGHSPRATAWLVLILGAYVGP